MNIQNTPSGMTYQVWRQPLADLMSAHGMCAPAHWGAFEDLSSSCRWVSCIEISLLTYAHSYPVHGRL